MLVLLSSARHAIAKQFLFFYYYFILRYWVNVPCKHLHYICIYDVCWFFLFWLCCKKKLNRSTNNLTNLAFVMFFFYFRVPTYKFSPKSTCRTEHWYCCYSRIKCLWFAYGDLFITKGKNYVWRTKMKWFLFFFAYILLFF